MTRKLRTRDELLNAAASLEIKVKALYQAIERDRASAELYYRACRCLEIAVLIHNADFDRAK